MPTIQYQSKALGLGPPPPITTADKWYRQASEPTRLAASVVLMLAASTTDWLFVPLPIAQKEPLVCTVVPPSSAQPRQAGWFTVDALSNPVTAGEKQPKVCTELPPPVAQPRMAGWITQDTIFNPLTIGEKEPKVCRELPPPTFIPRQAGLSVTDPLANMVRPQPATWFAPVIPQVAKQTDQGWSSWPNRNPTAVAPLPNVGYYGWEPDKQPPIQPRQTGLMTVDPLMVMVKPQPADWGSTVAVQRFPKTDISGLAAGSSGPVFVPVPFGWATQQLQPQGVKPKQADSYFSSFVAVPVSLSLDWLIQQQQTAFSRQDISGLIASQQSFIPVITVVSPATQFYLFIDSAGNFYGLQTA